MVTGIRRFVVARARLVLVLSVLAVALAGVLGAGALGKLKGGGFEDPTSESARARTALATTFDRQEANLVLLVSAGPGRSVDDPQVAADARASAQRLDAEPDVAVLGSYWATPGTPAQGAASGLRSTDGTRALVVAHVDGTDDAVRARMETLGPQYSVATGAARIQTGGFGQANADITGQVTKDLATAESIAIPLTLALLVVVFGAVVAGLLPLLVGGIAIAATFAVLSVMAELTDVSIFALNLTTALGLGLGIDYSLLVVSRFREELAAGRDTADAVDVTLRTAGRTVVFSAATIAVALSALLVFPLYFLRSFAYAGTAVVAVAALASVITLPALLVVLGPRVDALKIPGLGRTGDRTSGFWSRLASFVMRRPVVSALPIVALLLGMGLPFLHVNFGLPDDRALPASASQARQVGDVLRTDFAGQDAAALDVVVTGRTARAGDTADPAALSDYASRLSVLADVARVDAATGSFVNGRQVAPAGPRSAAMTVASGATRLVVVPAVDPYGQAAQSLVERVRATAAPGVPGTSTVLVGGQSASLVDVKATLGQRLPLAAGLIALSTFVLLFLFTGSVVLPLKALVINAVSLVGVLGVMVLIFQDGHLASVLGFTPMPLSITMPLLMFCVAFGLSMDYEVFLLGRIKEMHDAGADTRTAVAAGLERTGRIVSTAAALLAITFFAFVSSKVSFIQMFGLGTGIAIVLDATLVRGVLVPALMRIMGRVNWWAPAPLRRLHDRIGLSDGEVATRPARPVAVPEVTPAGA